jgi:hypothetical protein
VPFGERLAIGGDDPAPWNALAGGTIVALDRAGDALRVTITLRALRVVLELAACEGVRYQPHDEPALYELEEIATSEPDIVSAAVDHGAMIITGGAGVLRLAYANLVIDLEGKRVELAELVTASRP